MRIVKSTVIPVPDIDPLTRGLKAGISAMEILSKCRVPDIDPLTRGLKEDVGNYHHNGFYRKFQTLTRLQGD